MAKTSAEKTNYIPKNIPVKLRDVLVLYYNLYQAKKLPDIGVQDADNRFVFLLSTLNNREVSIDVEELEGLLWACVQMSERDRDPKFWHPDSLTVDTFIQRMMHHKQFKFYFDKIYSFFRSKKTRMKRIDGSLVSSEVSENVEESKEK